MASELLTYALIKSLYDRRHDYIDTFLPFVLGALERTQAIEIGDIRGRISRTWTISMPVHVVDRILRKAQKKNLIEVLRIHKGAKGYRLTEEGESASSMQGSKEHATQRMNALLLAICDFARREHGVEYSTERARTELLALIEKNLETFARYVNPRLPDDDMPDGAPVVLLRYIEHAKESVPEHYSTIRDMVLGSVITVILSTPDAGALNEISRPMAGLTAYLDSNMIFALLGMQSEHLAAAAKELIGLLKTEGIALRAFDFIVDEAKNVLMRYARSTGPLPGTHNPESVYVQLRLRGVRKSDAIELAAALGERLSDWGVVIERVPTFALGTYQPRDAIMFERLVAVKAVGREDTSSDTIQGAARIDFAAIETIMKRRGGRLSKLEQARAILLTRDRRLAVFNRTEMGHHTAGTIPEVILDSVLTNMLWLKNPGLDVSLESIIAAHSESLLRYDALWVRFSEILARLRSEGRIETADASALLAEEEMRAVMERHPNLDVDDVDEELVIDEARRLREASESRLAALEARVEEDRQRRRTAERASKMSERRAGETRRRYAGIVAERDESLRMFIRRQARSEALRYGAAIVVPIVIVVWVIAAVLMSAGNLSAVYKWVIACVTFLATSGLGWVVLVHLKEGRQEEIQFRLEGEHGLRQRAGDAE